METLLIPAVVVLCYIFAELIKKFTKLDTRWLPLICGVLGIVANLLLNMSFDLNIVICGLASGWASTGCFETMKNIISKGGVSNNG